MKTIGKCAFLALAGTLLASSPAWNGKTGIELVTEAQARVGQPLTPLSYAGVARRSTRRNAAASYNYPPPPPPPPPPPQPY
jgi:hypothetical protein